MYGSHSQGCDSHFNCSYDNEILTKSDLLDSCLYLMNQMRLTKRCNMTNNQLFHGKEMLVVYYYIVEVQF